MRETKETTSARRKRILCVDDEPAVRDMLSMYLRRIDSYEVETAAHGLAAWEMIAQDPARFDVIVTDNQMPQLDGIGLVEKLRASGFPGRIIFFSSTIAPHGAERVSRLEVDAVIEKGRPISELTTALRRALGEEPH